MGPWSQQLHLCIWRGTRQKPCWWHWQNSSLRGHQNRWIHTAEGWIHPHVLQQLNISTNQIRRTMHTEKVALLFHPSVPKPFAFHFPAPVLETAINCPYPPSLDNYSQLQGSASLEGWVSWGGSKMQRRVIMSCGYRSARCGRSLWDSQQTRWEAHLLLSQHHPQCAHQCHETTPGHSHHPQGYKCLKEGRELKHMSWFQLG